MSNQWIDSLSGPRLEQFIEKWGDDLKVRYGTDDAVFAVWLHTLNRTIKRKVGLSFDDLEDWDYWMAYDGDMSPKEAALEMLADNGYES